MSNTRLIRATRSSPKKNEHRYPFFPIAYITISIKNITKQKINAESKKISALLGAVESLISSKNKAMKVHTIINI